MASIPHIVWTARPLYAEPFHSPNLVLWNAVRVADLDRGVGYGCPAGMPFDGASVPRLFWRAQDPPMRSKLRAAAVPHDAGYFGHLVKYRVSIDEHGCLQWGAVLPDPSKTEIDLLFNRINHWNGVPLPLRMTTFYAVRLCGGNEKRGPWKRARDAGAAWDQSEALRAIGHPSAFGAV